MPAFAQENIPHYFVMLSSDWHYSKTNTNIPSTTIFDNVFISEGYLT